MQNKSQILLIVLAFTLSGCSSQKPADIQTLATDYYQTYAERNDFEYFLSFYDSAMVLEDIILGEKVEGIENFRSFFDWPNPNFQLKDSVALVVEHQVIDDLNVITSGYFTPFTWGDLEVESMHFTIIHTFNENGKIIRHRDWINYPGYLVDYTARKNSNEWIE